MTLEIVELSTANLLYRRKNVGHVVPSVGDDIFLPNIDVTYKVMERSFHYYDDLNDCVLLLVEQY